MIASPSPALKKVKSIDVIDDYTLRLNLTQWDAIIMSDLEFNSCFIMSPTAYEKHGSKGLSTNPVGTGP